MFPAVPGFGDGVILDENTVSHFPEILVNMAAGFHHRFLFDDIVSRLLHESVFLDGATSWGRGCTSDRIARAFVSLSCGGGEGENERGEEFCVHDSGYSLCSLNR